MIEKMQPDKMVRALRFVGKLFNGQGGCVGGKNSLWGANTI
jgi:hypothetical protein